MNLLTNYTRPVSKVATEDGRYAIVNDYGRPISYVSNRYTLINNSEIVNPLVEHFGEEKLSSCFQFSAGRNLFMKFNSGREFDLGEGDIIKEQFVAINSYDKTRSFQFYLGAFRKVCSNGMYAQFTGSSFRKIHVGDIPVKEIIKNALDAFAKNNFENWKRLKSVPLSLEKELELISGFKTVDVEDEADRYSSGAILNRDVQYYATRRVQAQENLDNQRNAWGLYNQLNRALTTMLGSRSNTIQNINTNIKAENYLLKALSLN